MMDFLRCGTNLGFFFRINSKKTSFDMRRLCVVGHLMMVERKLLAMGGEREPAVLVHLLS